MNEQKRVIAFLKSKLPKLVYKKSDDNYHVVGYVYDNPNGTKGFIIEGSGFSELEAWKDAYDWVNKIGVYRATDELKMF